MIGCFFVSLNFKNLVFVIGKLKFFIMGFVIVGVMYYNFNEVFVVI